MKTFIGLDIGGTKCSVVLANLENGIQILKKNIFATQAQRGFESIWQELCKNIDQLLEGLSEKPFAAGISCGGPLDSKSGKVLSPPNLPGWDNIPIVEMLSSRYGIPAFLQNDANACALAEWKLGAGRGCQDMIFLTMGTGMGAGIISQNQLLIGQDNMAGEVGHLRLSEEGPLGFYKSGSFEGFASGNGIRMQAIDLSRKLTSNGRMPQWLLDGYQEDQIDVKLLSHYAQMGNIDALNLFENVGRMLGRGISLLVDILNPQRIIIGSIYTHIYDFLRPSMEVELEKEALGYSIRNLQILPAQTGEMLGDYASIMTALHALGIDPMDEAQEENPKALHHFNRLLQRWPCLTPHSGQIMKVYLALRAVVARKGKILVCGNGGSCADAEHIVSELMKGFMLNRSLPDDQKEEIRKNTEDILPGTADLLQQAIMAICLNGHSSLSSATSNDLHPLLPISQQVLGYGAKGDVFLAISTSGNAKNLVLAALTAKALGITTIALTGRDGGQLSQICDYAIIAPGETTADIQEHHMPIYHTLCVMLEASFFDA